MTALHVPKNQPLGLKLSGWLADVGGESRSLPEAFRFVGKYVAEDEEAYQWDDPRETLQDCPERNSRATSHGEKRC